MAIPKAKIHDIFLEVVVAAVDTSMAVKARIGGVEPTLSLLMAVLQRLFHHLLVGAPITLSVVAGLAVMVQTVATAIIRVSIGGAIVSACSWPTTPRRSHLKLRI